MVGRLQGKHEMCPLTLTEFKMGALKNCYLSFRKNIAYFSIKKKIVALSFGSINFFKYQTQSFQRGRLQLKGSNGFLNLAIS